MRADPRDVLLSAGRQSEMHAAVEFDHTASGAGQCAGLDVQEVRIFSRRKDAEVGGLLVPAAIGMDYLRHCVIDADAATFTDKHTGRTKALKLSSHSHL